MAQSGWSLSLDVWSARFLAWVASWERDAELTPEAHAYFYDRYSRLAAHHRGRGPLRRAARLELKAREHYRPDNPGPPCRRDGNATADALHPNDRDQRERTGRRRGLDGDGAPRVSGDSVNSVRTFCNRRPRV